MPHPHHVRTQPETAIYDPKRRSSQDTESASTLILDFPASGIVRNKLLLFLSHLVYGVRLQQPERIYILIRVSHTSVLPSVKSK